MSDITLDEVTRRNKEYDFTNNVITMKVMVIKNEMAVHLEPGTFRGNRQLFNLTANRGQRGGDMNSRHINKAGPFDQHFTTCLLRLEEMGEEVYGIAD